MEIRLLGPLEVRDGERVVALPRRQQRALLAALALRVCEVVSTDRLVADLWGESAPPSATGSLQNTVAALRKLLGRDVLVTQAPGYRLDLPPEAVDSHRFERLCKEARDAQPAAKARLLSEGLELWRGPALADLDEQDFARLPAARLDELRVAAQEDHIDAELELGRHAALVGELEQLAATHPLRDRFRGQLMLALYRCGRHVEALEVYRAYRLARADELGLDPSPELQELERKILRQDPSIAWHDEVADEAPAPKVTELRLVTVLAVTPPAADNPEQYSQLLDETLVAVRDALDRHGGRLERFGAERLVAVFGADGSRDDDAVRAVLAARELGLPAGVATGEVVDGVGAVVTRAVELAGGGGVRLDERTAALVRAQRHLDAPLAGRTEELDFLHGALVAARDARRCRVVTIIGEPGIGKTRLAREMALREGDETTVLVARCVAHGAGVTFLPLLGALRRAEPQRALVGEQDAELVLHRLAALADGAQTAPLGESYWAVRRLLEALARHQPVLLVLDDIHWAEPALVDLIDYLADRVDAPLLVICLARPELDRPLGEPIGLGPLGEEEARTIVAGTAAVDEETCERIVELAEGNALYAEQLTSFAAEGGEGLPPTLEAVLAGRLGRLDPAERSILQRAAVVGREFSLGAVADLADGEVASELLSLSRGGFVHPAAAADPGDDGYTFHHVLLRDAAYGSLTKADRADLHERAAAWIDRDGPGDDAIAGYHLEHAVRYRRELGQDADELAVLAGDRVGEAGMRAWRSGDAGATVALLGRAVSLLPSSNRRGELQLERGLALRLRDRAGEADEAWAAAQQDAETVRSSRLRARVACERAQSALLAGELPLDGAAGALAEALPKLRAAGDVRGLARAELILSNVHWFACRYGDFAAAAARAEQYYIESGFSPALPLAIQAEALYYGAVPVGEALGICAELQERSRDRSACATASAVLGALRAVEGAIEDGQLLLAHARSLYEEIGNELGVLTTWSPLFVEVEALAGNRDVAKAHFRETIDRLRSTHGVAHATTQAALLADLLLDGGEIDEADTYARLAENEALSSDVLVQFLWRTARARVLGRAGKTAEAEEIARDAVRIASLTDGVRDRARAHFALAEVLYLGGKSEDARVEVTVGRRLLRQKGATALLERHRTPLPPQS